MSYVLTCAKVDVAVAAMFARAMSHCAAPAWIRFSAIPADSSGKLETSVCDARAQPISVKTAKAPKSHKLILA